MDRKLGRSAGTRALCNWSGFSTDSRAFLASAGPTRPCLVWDAAEGKNYFDLPGPHRGSVGSWPCGREACRPRPAHDKTLMKLGGRPDAPGDGTLQPRVAVKSMA